MNKSTSKNPANPTLVPLLVGLDWAKNKHDFCFKTPDGEYENGQVEHDQAKLDHWVDYLSGRFQGHRIHLCMEAGRSPLLWLLEKHQNVDLFVVNTTTAARYRKTFTPSGDKNDQRDAASILDLLERHPEKVTAHRESSPSARALHQLSHARRNTVDRRTGVISSLREVFELFYPVAPKLFEDLSTGLALEFFKRWPDASSLSKARESTLVKFFHQHRSRSQERIQTRLELIAQSRAPVEDLTLLEVGRMQVADHIRQIEVLNESIKGYEKQIEEIFTDHEQSALFSELPGAAENLAPRLLAAFSLLNPKDSAEMQTMAGIAPIRVQSGQSMKTFMRRQCPKFIRQSFHEFAGCSVNSSAWAKAYYHHMTKDKKCGANAAKRALAFKWIRILFTCWKNNEPYNELKYIAALQRRGSPLAKLILT
jgi:transposase